MKRIMIVGASVLQLPAILKAKEMGLYVAVVDYNPEAVGIGYADRYYNASTMDEDAVLEAALDFRPDGIITLATDMPMRGVARVCDRMGLHGISYQTAIMATDKYEMIKAFKDHGVPSPWYFIILGKEDLNAIKDKLSYPCIIKPTDNAGSNGVALVNSFEELVDAYGYSLKFSRKGKVIVEEYIDGPEVSVEVMVVNGKPKILQITDKLTTGSPHFVEMGHSQPSSLPEDIQEALRDVAVKACRAIGIDRGPAHVEMRVSPEGPKMIELGARMGGDNITTHLVPLSTGIDMVEMTIRIALGEYIEPECRLDCGSAIRYFKAPEGTISSISGIEEAKGIPGVKEIIFTKKVGDRSTGIKGSNDRIGFVIAQAKNAEEAVKSCEKALDTISIEIK